MKLIAAIQVLILLTSVIIPEGRHVIVRDCQCGDNCQCSEESRQSGTCCCGDKKAQRSSTKSSCCQKSETESAKSSDECCGTPPPVKQKESACCQRKNHAPNTLCCAEHCSLPEEGAGRGDGLNSGIGCGCQQTVVQLLVILMPRLRPLATTLHQNLAVIEVLPQANERTLANVRSPEVPPPQ